MERPKQFSENQYVGDKRTQVVYDVDTVPPEVLEELLSQDLLLDREVLCTTASS